ncbi:serine/threonine-protein kinase [Planctomonas deserti]|uniref:serine/threonine-protein kinase n=1 Tax=Planctomonas deserti TaxID=2144185 RepID=UPI000D3CC259|nr:serine/threonine-protein kinase [Planctomonas deserti]
MDGEQLGRGGFGTVWKARAAGGELVAVKVPNDTNVDTLKRFSREVRLQAALEHPHIAGLLDYDLQSTLPWCAMPLADRNFDEFVRDVSITPREILDALKQIMSGMGHAHQKHTLHRDLKPTNVLVYRDNGKIRCAVADFGLSRLFTREDMTYQTTTGHGFFSDWYSAPEQLSQFSEVTVTADVFSLGRIIEFCMLVRTDFAEEFPALLACAQVATRTVADERFPSVTRMLEAVELAGVPRAALARPIDQLRAAAASAVDATAADRLSELAFVLEQATDTPNQLLGMFATLPYALADRLAAEFPGRWRALLRAYIGCFSEALQVNAAIGARDFLNHCLDDQVDSRTRGLALFGLLVLGAIYDMPEFEDLALGWLYAPMNTLMTSALTSELARSSETITWLASSADRTKLPASVNELLANG